MADGEHARGALGAWLWGLWGARTGEHSCSEQMEIAGTDLFRIDATAVDEAGMEMEQVSVVIANVRDLAVVSLEPNGVLNCQKWDARGGLAGFVGRARWSVLSGGLRSSRRPQKLVAVLDADDEGMTAAKALGGHAFQALDAEGKAIGDAKVALSVDDGGVLVGDDGLARAPKPGLGALTGSLGGQERAAQCRSDCSWLSASRCWSKQGNVSRFPWMQAAIGSPWARTCRWASMWSRGTCEPHESATAVDVTPPLPKPGRVRVGDRGVRGRGDDAHATSWVRVPLTGLGSLKSRAGQPCVELSDDGRPVLERQGAASVRPASGRHPPLPGRTFCRSMPMSARVTSAQSSPTRQMRWSFSRASLWSDRSPYPANTRVSGTGQPDRPRRCRTAPASLVEAE